MTTARSLALAPVNSISVNAAAAKSGIPPSTISGWHRSGLVRVVERRGQAVLMVDADITALARNYTPGPGRGKRARLAAALLAS